MSQKLFPFIILLCVLQLLFNGAGAQSTGHSVRASEVPKATQAAMVPNCWIRQFAIIERWVAGMRPTVSARALAYIHMAAYETVLPSMSGMVSNGSKLEGLSLPAFEGNPADCNWNIALNACYAKMDSLFLIGAGPTWNATITRLKDSLNTVCGAQLSPAVFKRSVAWGLAVARAVWKYAESDVQGKEQTMKPYPKDYVVETGIGKWAGEKHGGYIPFTPRWGKVRTFTTFGSQLLSPPPPAYTLDKNSVYYKQHQEVYNNWKNMDYEKRWQAEFWSDDIVNFTFGPSTRIFMIAAQMVEKEHADLDKALYLYCKLGIGLNDATIACWNSKYIYNTERPWQYIKANIDSNFRSIMGESVEQAGKNPPFPGYPSGHSVCAGVGEKILTEFFGENYLITDYSHLGRNDFNSTPRTFTSMRQMAEDNAYSRIPMGAHVRFDCDEGLRLGRLVGENVAHYTLTRQKI